MKTKIQFVIILAILLFCQCKETSLNQTPKQKLSEKQVMAIAEKYNLKDSIHLSSNNSYLYMDEQQLEENLKGWRKYINSFESEKIFMEKTINVHTWNDYINLINSMPEIKESFIKMRGGIDNYNQWAGKYQNVKLHIYRNQAGTLSFIPEEFARPDDSINGVRMDYNQ